MKKSEILSQFEAGMWVILNLEMTISRSQSYTLRIEGDEPTVYVATRTDGTVTRWEVVKTRHGFVGRGPIPPERPPGASEFHIPD